MRLFNTLSGKKELLERPKKGPLKLFVCGPTVYDDQHIGNFRTAVFFDLFVRFLRARKFDVFFLQNITDIDDKILARSAEKNESWQTLAHRYETTYYETLKKYNVISIDTFARATDHIPEIIAQVEVLIKKGHTYKIPDDGWYFDLATFPEYGKLARRTIEGAEDAVSRIDESEKKRNKGDFCVWKLVKTRMNIDIKITDRHGWIVIDGEPAWPSGFGWGRPGWHIEDTAVSERFFGPQYDIHGGGLDLKFPHHEAEIAQQESASGKKPFVKIWMHAGMLQVDGEKMSKSKGNFITAPAFLETGSADLFRFLVFMHHYRKPLEYSELLLVQAAQSILDIRLFLAKLELQNARTQKKAAVFELKKYTDAFVAALEDDFNSPKALSIIFDLLRAGNAFVWKLSPRAKREITAFLTETFTMLGFQNIRGILSPEVQKRARARDRARIKKEFSRSDELRSEIEKLGYSVEDTPHGQIVVQKP